LTFYDTFDNSSYSFLKKISYILLYFILSQKDI
jgi:hypothetical protein